MRRAAVTCLVLAMVLVVAGCGSSTDDEKAVEKTSKAEKLAPRCPAAWKPGWQALANEVAVPVYCPSWMPDPLQGAIGGPWFNGRFVNAKKEYLVSWAWMESSSAGVLEVHVNLRGYPGRTAIPVCEDTLTVNGKTVHPKLPCFSDARGRKRFGSKMVTVYTANQGVDSWHLLYAWRHRGSLYTLSEHVAPPLTHKQVVANLDRMMRGLVVLEPSVASS